MVYKTLYRKLMIKQHEPHLKLVKNSGVHVWHLSCYFCYNMVINHEWGKHRIVITTNNICDTDIL